MANAVTHPDMHIAAGAHLEAGGQPRRLEQVLEL
jgi:hypothetical protein